MRILARLGAQRVWFSDGGVVRRIPGMPGSAGVSPACSDATHYGSEGITVFE
ncbi:hypothetical protein [Roseiflexus sp.]